MLEGASRMDPQARLINDLGVESISHDWLLSRKIGAARAGLWSRFDVFAVNSTVLAYILDIVRHEK